MQITLQNIYSLAKGVTRVIVKSVFKAFEVMIEDTNCNFKKITFKGGLVTSYLAASSSCQSWSLLG